MTKSKFPKAFAAVGLATVLVGCGSGSSTVEMMPSDSSAGTTDNTAANPPMPPNPAPAAPNPMATAKAAAENVRETVTNLVQGLGNYSTDTAFANAEKVLSEFQDLVSKDTDILPEDKIALLEAYEQLQIDFDTREKMKEELMAKNDLVTRLITALDAWDNDIDMNSIDLMLDSTSSGSGFKNPEYKDVVNLIEIERDQDGIFISMTGDGSSTKIKAFNASTPNTMLDSDLGTSIEVPDGWKGMSFMLNDIQDGRHLKIFTDHMNMNEIEPMFGGNWEEFWGATNNSTGGSPTSKTLTRAIPTGTINTGAAATNGPGKSKYFEEGYYSHAFETSNVDILRGASATTLEQFGGPGNENAFAEEPKEIIRIEEGESSAIHYTDIMIAGVDLMKKPLEIGTGSTAPLPSSANLQFATLNGQTRPIPVILGCSVLSLPTSATPNTPPTTANTGGGCEVSLNEEGFLKVEHIKLSDDGTKNPAVTDANIENNIARLTLKTTEKRSDLKDLEIDLKRSDTNYKVLGYWIDKHGTAADAFNIDTFATARYGPAGKTGIIDRIGMLAKTATYTGDSFGAYVMNKGDENNMDLYDGEFRATVTLNADFGIASRRAAGDLNAFKVNGEIGGFESLTRPDDDLGAWTLELNMSTVNKSDGSFSGTTTGGTTGGGKWQGQFYGKGGMDTPTDMSDDHPVAAVGDFSGDFGNSNRVVGVFGADKVEE